MGMTKCHGVTAIVIGVLQLVLGGGLIIASFVFASYGTISTSQTPYWGGFPFLITGAFGIAAGITKNQCCMVTFLVLNIIMTIVTAAASIVVTIAMAFWNGVSTTDCTTVGNSCVCNIGYNSYQTYDVKDCAYLDTITVALLAVLIFCYCCAGLAFAGSILGCAATCCAPPDATPTVIIAQPPMGAPGVVVSHSSMQAAGYPPVGPYGQAMYAEQTVSTHDKAPLVV